MCARSSRFCSHSRYSTTVLVSLALHFCLGFVGGGWPTFPVVLNAKRITLLCFPNPRDRAAACHVSCQFKGQPIVSVCRYRYPFCRQSFAWSQAFWWQHYFWPAGQCCAQCRRGVGASCDAGALMLQRACVAQTLVRLGGVGRVSKNASPPFFACMPLRASIRKNARGRLWMLSHFKRIF